MAKRQVSFFIETELFKQFSKKCIDQDKNKTEVLVSLISEFLKKQFVQKDGRRVYTMVSM